MNKTSLKIITGLVLVLLVAGGAYWLQRRDAGTTGDDSGQFIAQGNPGMTAEELKPYQDRIAQAESRLKEANDDQAKYQLYLQIGFDSFTIGDYVKAKTSFTKASEIKKDNDTPWAQLYVVHNAMRDYQGALKNLDKAIALNPSYAQYWRWKIELAQGPLQYSKEQQVVVFEEALSRTNRAADVLVLYAQYLSGQDKKAQARELLLEAGQKNPASKALYDQEIQRLQ